MNALLQTPTNQKEDILLVKACSEFLAVLRMIIQQLSPENFAHEIQGHSSIGKHIRHVLDYFSALEQGVKEGHIFYDQRSRDCEIERCKQACLDAIERAESSLSSFEQSDLHRCLMIQETISYGLPAMQGNSTLQRELMSFVHHGHHHLAMIRFLAQQQDLELGSDIGKAASTRAYEEQTA